MDLDRVKIFLGDVWHCFESKFTDVLHSDVELLNSVNKRILDNGGKQLRPLLCLLSGKACGELTELTVDCAVTSELIHTATLLHDDVADNSSVRRGAPTVMSLFGPSVSVLIGDYWLSKAIALLVGNAGNEIILAFSTALESLARGEMLQLQKASSGDTVEEDKSKRNPADFGLWFTSSKFNNQIMKWDSPWGVGYPGWHIECSGISAEYLGEYLDIHCGGVDNIFPHHSNEIAQSEAYFGHKWCSYWVHGEHLNDKNGKMSKSNGEFLTLSLLKENGYDPLSYRYFCLNSHYRSQLVFSYEALDGAQNAYFKLKNRIKTLDRTPNLRERKLDEYQDKFKAALSDDLNTASCITLIYDVLKDEELSDFSKLYLIEDFDKVLSLGLIEEVEAPEVDQEILDLIEKRKVAKQNKDYALADQIRDELLQKGIRLIDTREGTTYERI